MGADTLLENGVASIAMGVKDLELAEQDPRRYLSATRNFYAGVLLLLKECLHRIDPLLIAQQVVPVFEPGSGIEWRQKGRSSADFDTLQERVRRWLTPVCPTGRQSGEGSKRSGSTATPWNTPHFRVIFEPLAIQSRPASA